MIKSFINRREDFGLLLNNLGLIGKGVEIGTHVGDFAYHILSKWDGTRLFCVDPWITNLLGYTDIFDGQDREPHYQTALRKLSTFGERASVLRMESKDAAPLFQEDELDFVYIDGNHSREAFQKDMCLWWSKVKKGGLVAGHDLTGRWQDNIAPVVNLISDFTKLNVFWIPGDCVDLYPPMGDCASFYFIKET